MKQKILAIIPARANSKGVKNKNIRLLNGKPLITYSIEVALNIPEIDRIIVTTDGVEISNLCKALKVQVINRPDHLARDDSPTIDAVLHSLTTLKEEYSYEPDIVILLQPTSPLRTNIDITKSLEIFFQHDKNCLVSISETEHSPYWTVFIENEYIKPLFEKKVLNENRQVFRKLYRPNGAIFIAKVKFLKDKKTFYDEDTLFYEMPQIRSIDIDTELDFQIANCLITKA